MMTPCLPESDFLKDVVEALQVGIDRVTCFGQTLRFD
jgi:hypothetical protein